MLGIFVRIASAKSNKYPQHMFLAVLSSVFFNFSNNPFHLQLRIRFIPMVVITSFVVISNVVIKRVDCNTLIIVVLYLCLQMMLQISQFVMWMDASIRLKTAELDPLFKQAKQQGVMMYHNVWSLPAHIHEDTFKFLEESPCLYKNFTEYHAGLILIHSGNSVVNNYIIEPWVKCALIEECMKTKHDEMKILKCPSHTKFHSCHRFDQAILSLLIFRLFHNSFKDHGIAHSYFDICYDQTCWRS